MFRLWSDRRESCSHGLRRRCGVEGIGVAVLVELLVTGLLDLLTLILETIPDASLPAVASNALEDFAIEIGAALGGLDGMLPISEIGVFVGWVLGTYVPIIVAYQIAHWVWAHLPVIGSGG
jgi:hypothetical protein